MASYRALVLVPNTLPSDREQARTLLDRAPDDLRRLRNPPEGVVAIEANVRAVLARYRIDERRGNFPRPGWYAWSRGHDDEPLGTGTEGWSRDVSFADEVPPGVIERVFVVFGPGDEVAGLDVEDEARPRALRGALREHPECLVVAITARR